ncbi:hypothetical protein LTS10_000369 [Elasticomyces elasticus]|nr:hypothetical protein LTS10_000369 [Elasticomyces elasticus]
MEGSRKRKRTPRTSTSSEDGDDGDKKRGRPRVEKQDESAADRRRTQIRMAQRAYRQRKESTLEDLRKRVSELTNTLELMNKAFTELRDGMTSTATEVQLTAMRHASNQYEGLMQIARNPGEDEFDMPQPKQRASTTTPSVQTTVSQRRPEPINVPSWLDQSVLDEAQKRTSPGMVGMGYTMYLSEPSEDQPIDYFNTQSQKEEPALKQPQQKINNAVARLLPDSIPKQLRNDTTYSFQETTFARRLHRACLEAAYHVLLDPTRHRETYERVFGLSRGGLNTSTVKTLLARGLQDSLDFDEAPLIHVGGAGTHYPRRDLDGTVHIRKSSYNLGLVGPQTLALLETAAKNNLSTDMTVEIAGYEGNWFDPYDVEGYLEERGIRIDPSQSFIEAEIDDDSTSTSSSGPPTPPLEYPSMAVNVGQVPDMATVNNEVDKWNDMADITFTGVGYSDALTGDWMNFLEPGQGINWMDNHTQTTSNAHSVSWDNAGSTEMMHETVMENLDHSSFRPPQHHLPPANHRVTRKKNVIIDTSKLVKGVCLGRTPGYKRQDVDRALAMASFEL